MNSKIKTLEKIIKCIILGGCAITCLTSTLFVNADYEDLLVEGGALASIEYDVAPPENVEYNISQAQLTKKYVLSELWDLTEEENQNADLYWGALSANECDEVIGQGSYYSEYEKETKYYDIYCKKTDLKISDDKYSVGIQSSTISDYIFCDLPFFKQRQPLTSIKRTLGEGNESIKILDYTFMLYRGKYVPTISKTELVKNGINDSKVEHIKNQLDTTVDYIPNGKGEVSGRLLSYEVPLEINTTFSTLNNSDYSTYANRTCHNEKITTDGNIYFINKKHYARDIRVGVYKSNESMTSSVSPTIVNNFSAFGHSLKGVNGEIIKIDNKNNVLKIVNFYPSVRMYYEKFKEENSENLESTHETVDVLSEYCRSFIPYNYAEVGYYKSKNENVNLRSNQWSSHKRAVDKHGGNSVLPGGAEYTLDTIGNTTEIYLTSWQFLVPDNSVIYNALEKAGTDVKQYSLDNAINNQKEFKNEAIDRLEKYRLVLWVNRKENTDNIMNTYGLKINSRNQNISTLNNGSTTTSGDSKYFLDFDSDRDKSNEGDIDCKEGTTNFVYYKVSSDISGNIYLQSSSDLNSLKNSKPRSSDKILGQTELIYDLKDGKALQLDERTKLITNYVRAIKRNQGYDYTDGVTWVNNGRWYNESFEIYCLKQTTQVKLALQIPSQRSCILDPKLCPLNNGKSDMFSCFYSAQIKLNNYSDFDSTQDSNLISHFNGIPIKLNNIEDMFSSKMFYIPNCNVQDLNSN